MKTFRYGSLFALMLQQVKFIANYLKRLFCPEQNPNLTEIYKKNYPSSKMPGIALLPQISSNKG